MRGGVVLFGFLLAGIGAAVADEAPAPVELAPLQVTAGRRAEAGFDVPQAVTIVSPEDIERATPRTVADLLRGQAGAYVQSSGPGQGVVIMRGLKGSEVLHLVDGMRLNNAFFRNSPNQYIALVDPFNVGQVELLRGPASTLYGSDALGGVVHFLTPEERFSGAAWALRGGSALQLGSADLSRSGRVWAAAGHESLSLSGGVTYLDAGGIRTGGGSRIDQDLTGHHARGFDLKAIGSPAPGHELMASVQAFEFPSLPRYHEISVQPNSVANNPGGLPQRTEALFKPNARSFAHLRYRAQAPLGFVDSTEVHLARQVIDDDRSVIPQRPDQTPTRRELEANRSTLDGFTLLLRSGDLSYGGEIYRDRIDSGKRCQQLSGSSCAAASATTPVFPDGSTQRNAGVFIQSQIALSAAWRLDSALRYNEVRTDLAATPLSPAADVDDGDFTGSLGSAFEFAPGWKWIVNAGRGFRAPNLFDLGTLGPRSGSTQINVPNPDLKSETLLGADTGLKWESGPATGELVAFRTRYRDRIEPREPTGNTIPDGSFGCATAAGCPEVRSENISRATHWGFEGALSVRVLPPLELSAALNYTRGSEERDGAAETPANRVPPLNGRLAALWDAAAWEAEAFVLFSDDQHRLDADDETDIRIAPGGTPGWATLNGRAAWEPMPDLRLQLEAGNLLDAAYREHGSGIDGYGRSVTFSARGTFR